MLLDKAGFIVIYKYSMKKLSRVLLLLLVVEKKIITLSVCSGQIIFLCQTLDDESALDFGFDV